VATGSLLACPSAPVGCAPKEDPSDLWEWTCPEPASDDRSSSGHLDEGAGPSPTPTTGPSNLTSRSQKCRERQEPARQAERERKARVMEFVYWARARHSSTGEAAAVMGVPARTLSSWCRAREVDGLEARPRGRPPVEVPVDECGAVRNFLDCHGPIVGLPTLRSR
jgi:ubiquitin